MGGFVKISPERNREILGVVLLAFTALLFLALVTDGDQGRIRRALDDIPDLPNALGPPGAIVASYLYLLIGGGAHMIYCITCVWGAMLLRHKPLDRLRSRFVGLLIVLFSVAALLQVDVTNPAIDSEPVGGVIGAFFGDLIEPYLGIIGANVIFGSLAIIGILLSTEFLFVRMANGLGGVTVLVLHAMATLVTHLAGWLAQSWRSADRAEAARPSRRRRERGEEGEPVESSSGSDEEPAFARHFTEKRDLSQIRIRTSARDTGIQPESSGEELPFDDVPEINEVSEPRVDASTTQPSSLDDGEQDATRHSSSEDEIEAFFNAPEPVLQESDAEEAMVVEADNFAVGEQTELSSSVPAVQTAKPKKKRMPRRKTAIEDELPPDYEYPKRYTKPSIDLFDPPEDITPPDLGDQLLRTSALLEETLKTFGIEARVTDVTRGPTITRYELEPAPGIKVSRFLSLADDLALALKAHRVRVEAPIPGKGRVGIEVPNKDREPVVIRELLESGTFRKGKGRGKLPLALGKDIAGDVQVADLASMPHLLVAGATGAGKTVCVKALLGSLLVDKTPDELQLLLIDPKMVELSIFNDIPHLITPVVTDPKKAASALNWLIVEMEERYRLFAHLRVRNIEVYNQSVENGEIEMPEQEDGSTESMDIIRRLPYIVCIIDELADLMILARAEVEDAIARLAQLARAVGIHLIIATQRPSVDVLTGVIKANFPARVSFQVSSRVDSRCILDEIGAERLIGRGDMLYLPAGHSKPTRIQGAFVSDEEMNALIAYLKTQAPPQYRDEIERFGQSKDSVEDLADQDDELFDDAVRVVLETGQASISMVQRRLRVGYTRAARLIDMMELKGIVGPHIGSKAREILVDSPRKDEVA